MKNHSEEMNKEQVIALIRRIMKQNHWSQEVAAEQWGVSESTLSEVLSGKHGPGQKLLDALGLEHIDKYRWRKKD
jgi:transcriptional regulator with XRE-family HTH domain